MKLTISNALTLFGISLFCGIIIIAIGLGAVFPVISRIAAPISCPGRDLQLSTQTSSYTPGESSTSITWYCVDQSTGEKLDVSLQTMLAAGLIYSLLLFVILIVRWLWANRPGQAVEAGPGMVASQSTASAREPGAAEATLKKMEELKHMRDSNLISDQEYEQKKADILRAM